MPAVWMTVLMPTSRPSTSSSVQQRAAAVAFVHGRVGLDEILERQQADRTAFLAHNAQRGAAVEAERRAEGDDKFTHPQQVRVADLHRREGAFRGFDLDYGQVGMHVRADNAGR